MSLQDIAMAVVDAIMATIPRRIPDKGALQRCKIISHRGEHDNVNVMENTLQAYECARNVGVWGIEGDIRWTSDLVPVICHDPSPQRVFGYSTPLQSLSFSELRAAVPLIPSLEEVIHEFGGNTHLMLEIKEENWPDPTRQRAVIRELLSHLQPTADYHFLALDPALFSRLDFAPTDSFLPVAEINVSALSQKALAGGYTGLAGHYLLLSNRLKKRHAALGQRLGSGFPRSRNCLFRELNRGIEWIFTNDAVKLQGIRDHYLRLQ